MAMCRAKRLHRQTPVYRITKLKDKDILEKTKKIKVLHTEWSDGWGGQEIRIINEMLSVRERGIEVYLACRDHAKIKERAIKHGIKVYSLPFRGNADLKTLFGLIKIIKDEKIDIVNTHSGKDTWVGGFAAKIAGAKFIRTRHLSNKINPSRLNFINEMADFIITTGKGVREDMIRFNRIKPERIASIPTGIDESIFDPDKFDKEKNREFFGIKKDQIAIGILAVLRGFKRHDLFLEMAKEISKKYPQTVFLIAGDGPRRDSIKKMVKEMGLEERVKMLGHVNEPAKFLSALDIFTLTSDSNEGVPQSVMQALMMKLPVIATDVGSTKDLWHNDNFMLIEPKNIKSLVQNVEKLIQNPQLRENYGENARNFVVKNFSKKVMTDKIIDIYQNLLN